MGGKIITGTATEDNARVIRENRFGMAAIGDEQGACDWNFSSTEKPPATTTEIPTTTPSATWCSDKNKYCGAWAVAGECDKNPGYIYLTVQSPVKIVNLTLFART